MSASQNDYAVTSAWADIGATIAGVISTPVLLQNIGFDDVKVVFGGASAPTGKSGINLNTDDSISGTAAKVWVKSSTSSTLSVLLT
jgi:hypothetical protein